MLHFTFPVLLATAAETLLNHALHLSPTGPESLETLSGKRLKIELNDLNLAFTLLPSQQHILIFANYSGEVDAHVQGAPFSLLRLLLQTDATLTNTPEVRVQGDISIVQRLQHLLRNLEIDWEGHFAKLIGDIPAYGLGHLMRGSQQHLTQSFEHLQSNLEEYLQEEARHLPATHEINHFLDSVDSLRDDVARLEQRIQHLTKMR